MNEIAKAQAIKVNEKLRHLHDDNCGLPEYALRRVEEAQEALRKLMEFEGHRFEGRHGVVDVNYAQGFRIRISASCTAINLAEVTCTFKDEGYSVELTPEHDFIKLDVIGHMSVGRLIGAVRKLSSEYVEVYRTVEQAGPELVKELGGEFGVGNFGLIDVSK